jgi:hypothetical protein
MAAVPGGGKLYPLFTLSFENRREPVSSPALGEGRMVGVAIAMFVVVFGWGSRYFGWDDPDGKVQLALATCFVLGVVTGYKGRT